jgi:CheY-like chemotaxis protein
MKALRVLVVEDHADMRTGLAVLFKLLGCQSRFAIDLASARKIACEERFDVLLSDINLPDGDGWDLLRELQTLGCRPAVAVAMSGFGSEKDISQSEAAGFDVHLVKPFPPAELMAILERAAKALPEKGGSAARKRKMAHCKPANAHCKPVVAHGTPFNSGALIFSEFLSGRAGALQVKSQTPDV